MYFVGCYLYSIFANGPYSAGGEAAAPMPVPVPLTSQHWDGNLSLRDAYGDGISLQLGQLEIGSGTASPPYGAEIVGDFLGNLLGNRSHAGGAGAGARPFSRDAPLPGSVPCYDSYTWSGMLAAVANMAYTFSGHGTYPEQIRELTKPADFGKGFNLLYAAAQHGQSALLGSAPARPLCLLSARLAALGSSALPG